MDKEIGPAESKADLFVSALDAAGRSVIGPYQMEHEIRKRRFEVKTDVVITDADVSGLADPDDRTLTKIYVAFAPMLRSFAAQKGSADSDDVVQEVFIKFIVAERKALNFGPVVYRKDVWFSSRKEEFDSPWGCQHRRFHFHVYINMKMKFG